MAGRSSFAETARLGTKADSGRPLAESSLPSTQLSSFLTDPSRSAAPSNHTGDESEFDDSDNSINGSLQKSFLKPISSGSSHGPHTSLNGSPSKPPSASHHDSPESPQDQSHDFQNLSFMNDTKAQFDLAIDLDDRKSTQNARKLLLWLQTHEKRLESGVRKMLAFGKPNLGSIADSGAILKHDELAKQLTDCKIQLRLYDKFLQDLIDKKQIDVNEITGFHESWEYKELTMNNLRQEHEEMTSLVEDLYASLEEYQQKWRKADKRADSLHRSLEDLKEEVSKLVQTSGIPEKLLLSHDSASYINLAIPLLRSLVDSDASKKAITELEEKIEIYEKEARHAESLLHDQMEEIAAWKSRYNDLQIQLDDLQEAASTPPPGLSKDVEERLLKYEAMIDDLQKQINQRDETTRQSVTEISEARKLPNAEEIHTKYEELFRSNEELKKELISTKQKTSSTIKSLTNQLENRTKEQLALRDQIAVLDEVKHKLDVAVAKQRTLQSEKIRLSYQVDELAEEKAKLQSNIDVLTGKLQGVHLNNNLDEHPPDEAEESKEFDSSIGIVEDEAKIQFDKLYKFDFAQLSKMGETFDRLVDDTSINEPLEKIQTINEFLEKSEACILDYPEEVVSDLVQCHNSLFHYFIKATDLSVEDHISLLLKKEQRGKENDRIIEGLTKRIRELEEQNDSLARQDEADNTSPEIKLRIEELTARWKAEREARVYENRLAKRRFTELEDEISRLREVINTKSVSKEASEILK